LLKDDLPINYFTIIVFEERPVVLTDERHLTSKLLPAGQGYMLGIYQKQISLDTARGAFDQLCACGKNTIVNLGLGALEIGSLELLRKQFVPEDSTVMIPLNRILKNNFKNGSYTLEFFDARKNICAEFTDAQRRKIAETIIEHVPIDLQVISDRIGSVIFQFPSQVVFAELSFPHKNEMSEYTGNLMLIDNGDKLNLDFTFDPRCDWQDRYVVIASNASDETTTGFTSEKMTLDGMFTNDLSHLQIYDRRTKLLQLEQKTVPMMKMSFDMRIRASQRKVNTNGKTHLIDVDSVEHMQMGYENSSYEINFDKRKYRQRLVELEEKRDLLQFRGGAEDHEEAIDQIRYIIKQYTKKKIYLWDTFLSAEDIINTLYFCPIFNCEMKAITSKRAKILSGARKSVSTWGEKFHKVGCWMRRVCGGDEKNITTWIERQREVLEGADNTGIKLEFRCQHGMHGTSFHDRFLILIDNDDKAKVWSLGSSINSIGKSHTIIQTVQNPQYIVDAFESLWDQLSHNDCLVWRH